MSIRDRFAAALSVAALALLAPAALAAGNAAAAMSKVGGCVACHGADGIGKAPQYPNLQGQKAAYLEKQLKAFRSGERKDSNMNALAKPLSDEDIANLAAYFENVN
ncbi:cytochrome C [Denitratisoma sp. DHT3]|uniref:c-type cytochrome n=1 Tax=Denitratisoma sp. DHT3 TaxID=1981880 RepID=UPI001198352D|nr:cytochrome c [Denitratisoma sp. DHT3]QDX80255.1 cytochrome C [Denitratisoma sp. DHT3]